MVSALASVFIQAAIRSAIRAAISAAAISAAVRAGIGAAATRAANLLGLVDGWSLGRLGRSAGGHDPRGPQRGVEPGLVEPVFRVVTATTEQKFIHQYHPWFYHFQIRYGLHFGKMFYKTYVSHRET